MMRSALLATVLLAASIPQSTARPAVTGWLDRFHAGEFDEVLAELERQATDFDRLLEELSRDGAAWVETVAPPDRARRRLAAATFALEAGRIAAETLDWKWVQGVNLNQPWARPMPVGDGPTAPRPQASYRAASAIWWKTPPRLIEWGCALLRASPVPDAAERHWHLAAVAIAQQVGDYEFLVGSPWEERGNPQDEIAHLTHVLARFPDEPRFALAQAIAVEWYTWPVARVDRPRASTRNLSDAIDAFRGMLRDEWIGPEAALRTGYLRLRGRETARAIELFDQVEDGTRDPFLVYLARYFRGVALERSGKPRNAAREYRGALDAVPYAQSATFALAAHLQTTNRRREAAALVDSALAARPTPDDPWREYGAADARFWPYLRASLRRAITGVSATERR